MDSLGVVCDQTENLAATHKVQALGLSLQQASADFKEVVLEFQELKIQSESYKSQLITHKNKTCRKCTDLQKTVASKENIIELIASALTKLNDTKNFAIIGEMFKIIFGETSTLTPPKDTESFEKKDITTSEPLSKPTTSTPKLENYSTPNSNVNIKEESVSEIESTPTGRTSPIIHSKKFKSIKSDTVEVRVKKKSCNSWPKPDSKVIKLSYPSPSLLKTPKSQAQKGKLRQARLALVKQKAGHFVDLTSSPEATGSPRPARDDDETKLEISCIKKEPSTDYDDTILPSPTSGPMRSIFKTASIRSSPQKFIKTSVFKTEPGDIDETKIANESKMAGDERPADGDETRLGSPVSLKYFKAPSNPKKPPAASQDENQSQFDTNASLSLLQQVAQIEREALASDGRNSKSPQKRPLVENMNATNLPTQTDSEVSISVLHRGPRQNRTPTKKTDTNKRKTPEKPEDIFKEPTARTKAEKRALPGWSCEECKNFYGELYRDNHEMLLAKMQECSRHRGRRDPARPSTPPNFWNPRWDVPEDTEAFNQRNNAS